MVLDSIRGVVNTDEGNFPPNLVIVLAAAVAGRKIPGNVVSLCVIFSMDSNIPVRRERGKEVTR